MSVQFIGMIGHRLASEIIPPSGPIFDKQYIADFAKAHEDAGFDRILVAYASDQPDAFLVTAHAGANTSRIHFLLAHRPGFVAPTLAARKLATLDHLLDGRVAVHIISGGSDAEQRRDGDFEPKSGRYQRTDEYIDVLKKSWYSEKASTIRANSIRQRMPFRPSNLISNVCRCSLVAPLKMPSAWQVNMPMSLRCGANRWQAPRKPSLR